MTTQKTSEKMYTLKPFEPLRGANETEETRSVHALEYIAIQAGEIQKHLSIIASVLSSGGVNEKLRLHLVGIEKSLGEMAQNRHAA